MACQFDKHHARMVRNLLRLYRSATPADLKAGLAWYDDARKIVTDWAETYQQSTITVACVVAAISPQCEWKRNLIIADDVLAGRPASVGGALHVNIRKARAILFDRASDITRYFPTGPKVAAFALNLAGCYDWPTIDSHAAQAALNDPLLVLGLKPNAYECFARAYIAAARKVRLSPAVFQAIIWHVWKTKHPTQKKRVQRVQWVPVAMED